MQKIVIVGGRGGTNVGESLLKTTQRLSVEATFLDIQAAYRSSDLIRLFNWHFRQRYPSRLNIFSKETIRLCINLNPEFLIATGSTPINATYIKKIGEMGIRRINFLTDDPWNPAHRAPWFLKALPYYDIVFSPRRDMIDDLLNLGCRRVEYLPFGYDPDLFYPEPVDSVISTTAAADIMFAGGADRDRVPYIKTLIEAGFSVDLYGSYWERYPETKYLTKGQADVPTLRRAIQNAKIALCVVRHANRDGHCMRTFEVPAIGTCMLTEDTAEHREIFGKEGENVVYFTTLTEMVEKTQWLLEHDAERQRLGRNAHQLITQCEHTYQDRLKTMLSIANTI